MAAPRKRRVSAEKLCREAIKKNVNLTIPWYLMTSYLYYHEDENIISDGLFDQMCKQMLAHWDEIAHRHKHLVNREALAAGSGFDIPESAYPEITKSAALRLLRGG